MQVLIEIALKSVLVAGLALGLLALMKRRSAAERSWVAHIGLLALVIMAFAPLVLPSWNVEAPALFGSTPAAEAPVAAPAPVAKPTIAQVSALPAPANPVAAPSHPAISTAGAASAIYAVPAAILLLITFVALARLIALRARAEVLVDGHWLSALARAQRRMGFKHGTALLTSDDLASPISWGLMRPVILLNTRAVEASNEAEAIIAHELAHVARMDWVKLLLARIATALFWFNPLVWMLAREAHQLREEAADDAVLAADIADTDYAQLLVGVARHECPGLLLGAHGVAPSKSSLARRVARVLDVKSVRGPAAGSFALGVFVGAVVVAAPLAALTLRPAHATEEAAAAKAGKHEMAPYYPVHPVASDLPHIIAQGVSTSVATAMAAVKPVEIIPPTVPVRAVSAHGAVTVNDHGTMVSRAADGSQVTIYPPDAQGRRRVVARASNGAVAVSYADGRQAAAVAVANAERHRDSAIDRAVELKAVGASPDYVASIRSVAPGMRLSHDDIVQLAALGVKPDFIQELARAGYRGLSADEISSAYAVGIRSDYIRGMAAAGFPRISIEQLIEMRTVGITPADVERFRRAGFKHLDVDEMVEAKTLGLTPEEIRASQRDDP
jgi:beta-lactamase regulating signal transducer with metallopeptidase domain